LNTGIVTEGGEKQKIIMKSLRRGFTLIELLIVMAILGVLAVVVLVAINPVQQLARTRDSGRKAGVTQIGHALEAYYTTRGGMYVPETTGWVTALVDAGELSTVPSAIQIGVSGVTGCTTMAQNGWCYDASDVDGAEPAIVFTELESQSETSKCDTAGHRAFFIWSTADGRGGLVCGAAEPTAGAQTWNLVQ